MPQADKIRIAPAVVRSAPRRALTAAASAALASTAHFRNISSSSRRRRADVMRHLLGFVSKRLNTVERAELTGLIEEHRNGPVPPAAPVTPLNHSRRRQPNGYAQRQCYLRPHPKALMPPNLL